MWLIKANPYCGGYVMVEAAEPGVSLFIGGAGFAADVIPSQGLSASAGASSDYIPHHGMQDVYRAFIGQTPGNANFFLVVGVVLVQAKDLNVETNISAGDSTAGFLAVMLASLTSGLAGVVLEKLYKDPRVHNGNTLSGREIYNYP